MRRMFTAYVGGRAPKAIAADLRRDGITRKRGGAMDAGTVSAVLRNSIYVEHGVVDTATWEAAQVLRIATGKVSRGRRSEGVTFSEAGTCAAACAARP